MRTRLVVLFGLSFVATNAGLALAQDRPAGSAAPGVITEGSANTSIGGQAAARKGDAVAGDGAIAEGSSNVFINGKPVARTGDLTTGCPDK